MASQRLSWQKEMSMNKQQIAAILAQVNQSLLAGRYDRAAAYELLREKFHEAMYDKSEVES